MNTTIKNPNFINPELVAVVDIDKAIFISNNTISYKELNASYGYSMNSGTK